MNLRKDHSHASNINSDFLKSRSYMRFKKSTHFFSTVYKPFLKLSLLKIYLLRSCSGECLGSSSDEERSELRYSIWIAEFRELVDLWTHAAFWLTPVCSFTGVYNSFSVTISVVSLRARSRKGVGASNSSRRLHCCQASCSLLTNNKALVIHSCWVHSQSQWVSMCLCFVGVELCFYFPYPT